MKFVVVICGISEMCGGVNVLCQLAKTLADRGHDSKIYLKNKATSVHNTIYNNYHEQDTVDDETFVIYPEMDVGNSMNAKNVIRWVLYGAHMYEQYSPDEIIYYYAPFCKNNTMIRQQLNILYVPPGVTNQNRDRPNELCYIVKKGWQLPAIRRMGSRFQTISGTCLDHVTTHNELIEIFNTTTYFYCYDPCSFLVLFALMCGCIVYKEPVEGYTEEEWMYAMSFHNSGRLKGFAYGVENLQYARDTIQDAGESCRRIFENSDKTVDVFLHDIENGLYTKKPCYRFNELPYSFQHVNK